jgi:hypothetical protein
MLTASTIKEQPMNDFIFDDIEFDAYLEALDELEAERNEIHAELSGDEYADAVLSTIA